MNTKIIKAPAGVGKTSVVVNLIRKGIKGKVEIYVPTIKLAEEIAAKLNEQPGSIFCTVVRGRGQKDQSGEEMCKKHIQAAEIARKGWPVTPLLCVKSELGLGTELCEHYDSCPYIKQFDQSVSVRIYTHAYLPRERGMLDGDPPDWVVIDESFWSSCLEQCLIPIPDLLTPPFCVYAKTETQTKKALSLIAQGIKSGTPLLDFLRKNGGPALIASAVDELAISVPSSVLHPGDSDEKQRRGIDSIPPRREALSILEALKIELTTTRSISHAVSWSDFQQAVVLNRRLPITRFKGTKGRESKVLIIDANADPTIIEQWFPGADFKQIPAERNVFVVQCLDSRFSTTSLTGHVSSTPDFLKNTAQRRKGIEALIRREASEGRKVLVVGPQVITGNPAKKLAGMLQVPSGVELAHFGGIRGVDIYKSFDTVIIVGRNEPPIEGAEGAARGIWFDSEAPLSFASDWHVEVRGYTLPGQSEPVGIEVPVHPDSRVQRILEQVRESETTQAIDRLRHVHSGKKKRAIILSNIPVDIRVDVLLTWGAIVQGNRLAQAWERLNGVMPLAPDWLAKRFPDLWVSADAAKADLRRSAKGVTSRRGGQKGHSINSISISNSTLLDYEYRVADQPRRSQAISTLPWSETLIELSRLLGKSVALREGIGQPQNPEYPGYVISGPFLPSAASVSSATTPPKPQRRSKKNV